jgi:hypothetical protein
MAGAGVKLFKDGIVLTAAEVNGYLMDQSVCVFDNPTQRDLAFGGENEPALSAGRLCFLKDKLGNSTNVRVIQFYDGSQWVDSSSFTTPDDSITNAKVSATAAIALSKLAPGTSGQIIVANASGVPTYVTLGGDATISNTGVLTIGGNTVVMGTDTAGAYVATIAGTANQITASVSAGDGNESASVTLSLPQDINITNINMSGTASVATNLTVSGSTSVAGAITAASASVAGNVVYNIATASVANSASITSTNSGKFIETSSASPGTIFVTGNDWAVGAQVTIMQMSSASLSSASISFPGQTLRGTPLASPTVAVLRTQYSSVTLINRAENDWFVIGDLKA